MPSVVREGPDLGRPAAPFDCVGPFRADTTVRAINLVSRAIARAVMRYLLLGDPDAHGKGLSCHPRHRTYTGDRKKIGDMLRFVDLVKELLVVGINIHAHQKEVL